MNGVINHAFVQKRAWEVSQPTHTHTHTHTQRGTYTQANENAVTAQARWIDFDEARRNMTFYSAGVNLQSQGAWQHARNPGGLISSVCLCVCVGECVYMYVSDQFPVFVTLSVGVRT